MTAGLLKHEDSKNYSRWILGRAQNIYFVGHGNFVRYYLLFGW